MADMDETTVEGKAPERTDVPPPAWRWVALAVPALVVLAFVLFAMFMPMSNANELRQSDACRWMWVPWSLWAVSYGGLVASVVAVVLRFVLGRYARSRGWDAHAVWQGKAATGFAMLGWPAVLMLAVAVWLNYGADAETAANLGKPMCEGLGLPTG